MVHSDDEGLILPPRIAPHQVVIIPLQAKTEEDNERLNAKVKELMSELKKAGIRVILDDDDTKRPGFKFAEHELKGIPVRVVLGMRDLQNNVAEVARRDTKIKAPLSLENFSESVSTLLEEIQLNMYDKAKSFREENIRKADNFEEFQKSLDEQPGFILAHWDGTAETEDKIKELTKATIRCIPLNNEPEEGKCILTGNPSSQRVLFARAY